MIGYKTQVLNVKDKSVLKVVMQVEATLMDEVVVVGYGTMKKSDLSGSVAQIKSEDLVRGNATDVARGLQGKIAGVQVSQSDGSPGSGREHHRARCELVLHQFAAALHRGRRALRDEPQRHPSSSANEGNNQFTSPLNMINPNDIEKIEVLKDASATAIYGSRGANGVVIITTKKGQQNDDGRPMVELNMKVGMQSIARRVQMLDARTYALYQNEAAANSLYYEGSSVQVPYRGEWTYPYTGNGFVYTAGSYNPGPDDFLNPGLRTDEYGNRDEVVGTNWQDEIYRTGWQQDYNLSVSNGTSKGLVRLLGQLHAAGRHHQEYRLRALRHLAEHRTAHHRLAGNRHQPHFTHSTTDFQRTNSENTGIIRSALIFPPTYGPRESTEQLDELNWLRHQPGQLRERGKRRTGTNQPGSPAATSK